MTTSKPFSTISYNSENYLISKLKELVDNGYLEEFCFIPHAKEEDEEKDHLHVYMIPAKQIDTRSIKKHLEEFDKNNPDKPLTCITCRSSKFDDFYLYGLHDKAYLLSKGMSRKYHYVNEQFFFSDSDFFAELIRTIDRSKYVGMERLLNAVEAEMPFSEMVRLGQIPIQLINQYQYAYELIARGGVERAGRETHTPKTPARQRPVLVDEETGEILYECNSNARIEKGSRIVRKKEQLKIEDVQNGENRGDK